MSTSRDHSDGQGGGVADGSSPDAVSGASAEGRDDRLGRVEAEVAFQGDALREVSDALGTQQVDILALRRQVQLLGEQLSALRGDFARTAGDGSDDEPPPPHY